MSEVKASGGFGREVRGKVSTSLISWVPLLVCVWNKSKWGSLQ